MKQKLIFILILFVVVLSVAYYGMNNFADVTRKEVTLVSDYFPNREMIKVFNGGFENGGEVQFIDRITDNKIQTKKIDTATGMVHVSKISEDKITTVYVLTAEDERLKKDYLDVPNNREDFILNGPIKKGFKLSDGSKITNVNMVINTTAGEFEVIEISDKKLGTKSYLAKGLGVVKTEGTGFDLDLAEIHYDVEEARKLDNLLDLYGIYYLKH